MHVPIHSSTYAIKHASKLNNAATQATQCPRLLLLHSLGKGWMYVTLPTQAKRLFPRIVSVPPYHVGATLRCAWAIPLMMLVTCSICIAFTCCGADSRILLRGTIELEGLEQKAKASGASQLVVKDLKEEFVRDYIFPCLTAGTVYERKYLLGISMARPVIAKGHG